MTNLHLSSSPFKLNKSVLPITLNVITLNAVNALNPITINAE